MAAVYAAHKSSTPYSTLEVVDPHSHPQPGTEGLQPSYLFGDENLNGKEVVREEGIEVTKDDDKQVATNDIERADGGGVWTKRRICGIPVLVVIALLLLVMAGAVVGGVLGGNARKQKVAAATPEAAPNPGAPATITTVGGSATESTTSVGAASTSSSTLEFQPPVENRWYHILNDNGTSIRALRAYDLEIIDVADPTDDYSTYWHFTLVPGASTPQTHKTPFYFIGNRNKAANTMIYENFLLIGKEVEEDVHMINDAWRSNELSWWYFGPGDVRDWNREGRAWMLWNEKKRMVLGYGKMYGNAYLKAPGMEDASSYWYLEDLGPRTPS